MITSHDRQIDSAQPSIGAQRLGLLVDGLRETLVATLERRLGHTASFSGRSRVFKCPSHR